MLLALWNASVKLAVILLAVLLTLGVFTVPPRRASKTEAALAHVGVIDRYKNPPVLVLREQIKPAKTEKLIFFSAGISLDHWVERQSDIQDVLNVTYAEPPQYAYNSRNYIVLTVLPGTGEPRKDALYDDEL